MLKFILLGIIACIVCICGAFTRRDDNSKIRKSLWWIGFFLSLAIVYWGVCDSIKSNAENKLKLRISVLAHDATYSLNSRQPLIDLESIVILSEEATNHYSDSIKEHLRISSDQIRKFYWSFRYNPDAYAHELKFHLQSQPKRLQADRIHGYFHSNSSSLQKRIHSKYVADRQLEYFIEDLVYLALHDPNLKVASAAVTAIESLTNQKFSSMPPYDDVQMWWDKKGSAIKKYKYPSAEYSDAYSQYHLHWENKTLHNQDLEKMKHVVNGRKGFGTFLAILACFELDKGNINEALDYYNRLWNECDGFLWDKLTYIAVLSEDDPKKAQQYIDVVFNTFYEDEYSYEISRHRYFRKALDKGVIFLPSNKQKSTLSNDKKKMNRIRYHRLY